MKYWYQKPHHALSEYLRTVLVLEGFSESDGSKLPLFTNGMPALVCRTEKDTTGTEHSVQISLYGKSTPADCWEMNGSTTIIAYFCKPFTLASIFNIPAKSLLETSVELSNWNPHKANALKLQLVYAASTDGIIEILDNLVIRQLEEQKRECEIIKYATDQIMCDSGTETLSTVLKALALTERTFQRVFKKYVGVTANQYRRICQFQLSFAQVKAEAFDKLTDVAYDNGFADQSHFIRSFREFTQITPNAYIKSGLKDKNE